MRSRMIGVTLAAAALFAVANAHADTFTLNDALATAYDTNPVLDAQRASLRATDEQVAQANANWRPIINAGGTYGRQHIAGLGGVIPDSSPLQGQLTITEPIFRGGRTYAEVKRAKALVGVGRANLLAQEQTILLNTVTAYMDVVRDSAIVSLRQSNVEVLTRQRDETKAEFNAGSLTRTDLAQSEARLAGAQASLTAAQGQLQISRANYEQVIGRPAETLENLPTLPKLPNTPDIAINLALAANPALTSAKANERAADYAVDDALGALAPSLSVQGQYQYSGGSVTTGLGPGATFQSTAILGQLNVPIYQGGAEEASVRQAKELLSQAKLNAVAADRQVHDAVEAAWAMFNSANATITSNQLQVDANQSAYTGVKKEQQVGGRTILDVLNAEQELLNAQVALVSAQRDTVVAAYSLLAATGHLTAQDLGLKVKVYNPRDHYDEDAAKWFGLD